MMCIVIVRKKSICFFRVVFPGLGFKALILVIHFLEKIVEVISVFIHNHLDFFEIQNLALLSHFLNFILNFLESIIVLNHIVFFLFNQAFRGRHIMGPEGALQLLSSRKALPGLQVFKDFIIRLVILNRLQKIIDFEARLFGIQTFHRGANRKEVILSRLILDLFFDATRHQFSFIVPNLRLP